MIHTSTEDTMKRMIYVENGECRGVEHHPEAKIERAAKAFAELVSGDAYRERNGDWVVIHDDAD